MLRVRQTVPLLVLLCPLLMASKCRKEPEADILEDLPLTEVELPGPEVDFQLVAINPANIPANTFFDVHLYGSGFEDGVVVEVGDLTSEEVSLVDDGTLIVTLPPIEEGVYDVSVVNPDGLKATRRAGLEILGMTAEQLERCNAAVVHFELDSADLKSGDEGRLEELAPCLLLNTDRVVLEGHTDERGSTTYNLALGQRRADSVERQLVSHGVTPSRLRSMSFGEERPVELGNDEDSWQENRRVELKVLPK